MKMAAGGAVTFIDGRLSRKKKKTCEKTMEGRNRHGLSKYKRSSRLPILRVDMRSSLFDVLGQLYSYLSSLMTIYAIT